MINWLLTDVFTFLCFLHGQDVAPRRARLLPPLALARLNQQLAIADAVELAGNARPGGKRGTSERETERIRFVHFLSEAAGLVALTGRFLKPTPRAALWLAAPDEERTRQLFDAAFPGQPDRARDQLWRAYHLPGWQLTSPTTLLAPLLDILRQMRREERLKLSTLLKLVPLSAGDQEPEAVLRDLLRYLDWFGVVRWRGRSAIELTDWGARLLNRPDALLPLAPLTLPPSLLEMGEGTRAGVKADGLTLYELSEYAELASVRPRRIYRLDRARVQRALERGTSLQHIAQTLTMAIGKTLPAPVAQWLQDWAREVSRVTLRHVTLLEVTDPQLLSQLTGQRRIRADIQRTLSPRVVVVRDDHLPALIRRLARSGQGLVPRVEFPVLASPSTRRKFDQPSLAHLYLSVRLCHQLADLIPSAYRAPYSILLDLEAQLNPRDRDLAAQLADEAADRILHPPHIPPRSFLMAEGMEVPPAAETIADMVGLIERAIEAGTPLDIVYYSPYRDEVTTRVVEPHRIEWHGRTPYLIAYCQRDGDERTTTKNRLSNRRSDFWSWLALSIAGRCLFPIGPAAAFAPCPASSCGPCRKKRRNRPAR